MSLATSPEQTDAVTPLLHTDADERSDGIEVSTTTRAIVVVGSGPVGMHFVNELVKRKVDQPVILYGAEPWQPYDRVKLSSYLAGDIGRDDLEIDTVENSEALIERRYNCPVKRIDRTLSTITDAAGRTQHYSQLVLAVGSKPFIPNIYNIDLPGVYTFRSLSEADELFARTTRSKHTVVLGGGLLGLETARAMRRFNTDITIIEHNNWLMMQQLDEHGGELLKRSVEQQGMDVIVGNSVEAVIGKQRVEGVKLRNGLVLDCDTLIVATGIRANLELAREARLLTRKGILVDDQLRTSSSNIYAIGECAEHDDVIYGLVKPGFDMSAVLAEQLTGGEASYHGSVDSTRLKVMQQKVFSAGRTGALDLESSAVKEYIYESEEQGVYRKLRVHRDRLIGVVAIGDWHEAALLQDAVTQRRRIWLWHIARFKQHGYIWNDEADTEVSSWPASAVVCNCTGVTRGQLSGAVARGCSQVECLTAQTRAGSVCGSCKPVLAELVGETVDRKAVRGWRSTLVASITTLLLAIAFLAGSDIPYADTVQLSWSWDVLWRDTFLKQVTGFSLLGLGVVGMLLSMRKRITAMMWGDYAIWRMVHIALGILALLTLVAHTGFRIGDHLNLMLMLDFLMLAVVGALASSFISTEHLQSAAVAKRQRARWTWIHILLVWPLPVLLGFHIVKSYYY